MLECGNKECIDKDIKRHHKGLAHNNCYERRKTKRPRFHDAAKQHKHEEIADKWRKADV